MGQRGAEGKKGRGSSVRQMLPRQTKRTEMGSLEADMVAVCDLVAVRRGAEVCGGGVRSGVG